MRSLAKASFGVLALPFALAACTSDMSDDGAMASSASSMSASGEQTVMVGGAAMYPSKNIVENALNSKDHTTLVAAVKAAGLVDTLMSPGPFTVFAPTNAAFGALPAGTVDTLLKPENKAQLANILTYHVVPGRITAADLMERIRAGGGKAILTTASGGTLSASMMGNRIMLTGSAGGMGHVTTGDVFQSNGIIHVIDGVVLPN